jgi:hypothetical protein
MAHPAEFFIKYLLVIGAALSYEEVVLNLEIHGLSAHSEEDHDRLQREVSGGPKDFRPWDPKHRASTRWLREKKIFSLVHPDAATHAMKRLILGNPHVREKAEALVMSGVPFHEAAANLGELGCAVPELAVAEFRHYFWNPDIMGVGDWAEYLQTDSTKRTYPLQSAYQLAVRAGPEAAAYRLGVHRELDGKKIMVEVQRELYHSFLEARSLPLSSKKVEMLGNLARGLARIDERVQAGDSALQETLKKFEKFKVLHGRKEMPSLIDLAPTGSVSNRSRDEILQSEGS